MIPVAIYTRVSTTKNQNTGRQIFELQEYAHKNDYQVVSIISEQISGATKNKERPGIQQLYQLVNSKQIQKVLVHEISRLGRSTSQVLSILEDFTEAKVSIYNLNMGLETLTPQKKLNPAANIIFMVLAEVARMEREQIRERIISGLENAKRKGKKLGRREGSKEPVEQLLKKYPQAVRRLKEGHSLRNTSQLAGVSINTARKLKDLLTNTQDSLRSI